MILVAIDIGNSKTEYLTLDKSGTVLSQHIGGGANYQAKGMEKAQDIIHTGLWKTLIKGNHSLNDVEYVYIGAAGADTDNDFKNLHLIFKNLFKNVPFDFNNDGFISLKNGIINSYGIVITCGTGNTNFAYGPDREVKRLGGYCLELGDILGAETIAKRVTHLSARSADGRDYPSILPEIIRNKLNLNNYFELINLNLESHIAPIIISALAEGCDKGDGLALSILWEITKEVILITREFYNSSLKEAESFKVVLDGHIFRENSKLIKMIRNSLESVYNCSIVIPETPPVVGSYYLAMEALGLEITDQITKNIIKTYKR